LLRRSRLRQYPFRFPMLVFDHSAPAPLAPYLATQLSLAGGEAPVYH
jgi:hypothetical protein